MRLAPAFFLLATACPALNTEVDTRHLESGTYTLVDDTADVTLTVDVSALTFTLAEEGGETVEGTLALASESDWAECCYVNGSGHSVFETFHMAPATFTVGPMDITDGALVAGNGGPTIQEFVPQGDANSGFDFR